MSTLPPTPGLQTSFEDNNDDLLHLLTDAWENPLKETIVNSKWTRDYLSRLTSLPLDELLHESVELREEQSKAKRDAQQLAFRDYPSFLHAQTCRHEAEETLDGLYLHLGDFLSSVPELQQVCEEFTKQATTLKEERGKITSVLEHQNVLTDLLEIPQLMETCVWNGYYSEAMDLASHVRLLQVRYPLPVIKSIQQQVQASSDLMLVQLVSHLQKPIRLAAAMNVVGFLRRMDVFESEIELRMVFLRCRHEFLQQRLIRIKRDISEDSRQRSIDAFEHLKRFIDVMREQMFEIGTQYISIFSNEKGTLLSDYMVNITGLIKSTLQLYLPMIEDTSALTSLLTQLQYCGLSLGRIGLDFRHIFVHSFEEAVQPMILKWIDSSTEDIVKIIVQSTEEALAPSKWMSSKIVSQNTNEVKRYAFQPPMLLVGYPSLAIFTNDILSAFNALRLLPAVSLYLPIQNHLEACFLEIGNALNQYSHQAADNIPNEITFIQSYTAAFVRCCVPYLKSCLVDGIYGDLSVPSTADEDLELLLAKHLPVVKKEIEEFKEKPIESTNNEDMVNKEVKEEETQTINHIDENDDTVELESKEITQNENTFNNTELVNDVVENDVNDIKVDPVDKLKEVVQGEDITQREKEDTNELITPKEDIDDVPNLALEKTNSDDTKNTEEPTILSSEVNLDDTIVTEKAEKKTPEQSEKPAVENDNIQSEESVQHKETSTAVNEPKALEKPTAKEPTVEEPIAEEITVEEPIVKEPIIEQPIVEEPIVEEPTVEEPVAEDTIVKEDQVVKDEPIVEDSIAKEEQLAVKDESKAEPNKDIDETTKTIDNNTDINEEPAKGNIIPEEISTTEQTDEEHKEEEEGEAKTAPEKKSSQKKPKKKGKKGRR